MKYIFREPLQELFEYDELKTELRAGRGPLQAGGCLESQKAHLLGALMDEAGCGCHLVVTYSEKRARELSEDLALFAENVCLYPAKDMLFYAADVQGSVTAKARLSVVRLLAEYREGGGGPVTVVTTIDGLMDHLQPIGDLVLRSLTIEAGQQADSDLLLKRLTKMGYERAAQVESAGQFSMRGGIVDIFPLTEELPVRMEFFGDEIDSLRSFDAESQRSVENLSQVTLYPVSDSITSLDGLFSGRRYGHLSGRTAASGGESQSHGGRIPGEHGEPSGKRAECSRGRRMGYGSVQSGSHFCRAGAGPDPLSFNA